MKSDAASILIVGSEEFGEVAERVLKRSLAGENFVRSASWEAATPIWSNRLFQETDLFILELFRQYPTGFRPEGLITAALIVRKGAQPLVVICVSGKRDFLSQLQETDSGLLKGKVR